MKNRSKYGVTVSALALVVVGGAAQAAPVTKPFTHTLTRPLTDPGNSNYTVEIDLNEDGVKDVRVTHATFTQTGVAVARSLNAVDGLNGASILFHGGTAAGLKPGEPVDPAGTYAGQAAALQFIGTFGGIVGNPEFLEPDVALGVRIPVGGQSYYAWLGAQLLGSTGPILGSDTLLLHDYGYETTPDIAVAAQAPEPASLALLGLAAVPMLGRRRR